MNPELRNALERSGAVLDGTASVARHFGDPALELRRALEHAALAERSDLSRLLARGADFLDLVHRLGTGDVKSLRPGQGAPTVLTNNKGRIVRRVFLHHLGEPGVLVVAGPDAAPGVIAHLARYTFREDTRVEDVSGETCLFTLLGPRADAALRGAALDPPNPYQVVGAEIEGHEVHVLGEDGFSGQGYSVLARIDAAPHVWSALLEAVSALEGGGAAGSEALEACRVLRGLGADGHELTGEHNPLEAGLAEAVSFTKGCYVGQEVVARLKSYDKVSREVMGVELAREVAPPAPGTRVLAGGREIGEITSALLPPGWTHAVALAYVKRRDVAPGMEVELSGSTVLARLVGLPFAS